MSPPLSTGVTTMEPYHPRPRYQPDYLAGQYPVITEQPASNTTPVVTQQAVVIQAVRPTDLRDWNSQLCGCFEDWGSCKYISQVTQKKVTFGVLRNIM